jgi:hypothetical protein
MALHEWLVVVSTWMASSSLHDEPNSLSVLHDLSLHGSVGNYYSWRVVLYFSGWVSSVSAWVPCRSFITFTWLVAGLLLPLHGRDNVPVWRSNRLQVHCVGSCILFWLFSGFSFYLVVDCNAFQCYLLWFLGSLSLVLVFLYIIFLYLLFYSIVNFDL